MNDKKKNAGRVMADLLADYGVTAVFGVPGGQTLPLYYGIEENSPRIQHVLMRDESNAGMAADAYARISGKLGAFDGTAGCGAVRFVAALAEAYNSSSPVIAIAPEMTHDQLSVRYRGCGAQLADCRSILKPVTKWAERLPEANSIVELTQFAARTALSNRPGPVYVECPWDLFDDEYTGPEYKADKHLTGGPAYRSVPPMDDIKEAVTLLKKAKKPIILAGGGTWFSGAQEELTKLSHTLSIPVATSLSGKGILSENDPLSLGVIGALGGNPISKKYAYEADLIFAIGFKFSANASFNWELPTAGQKVIHLDIDAVELGKMADVEIGLLGDAKVTLESMNQLLTTSDQKEFPTGLKADKETWLKERNDVIKNEVPIIPQQVISVLNEVCSEDTIVASDASFSCGWIGTYFDVYGQRRTVFPRGMSGLGYGLPAGVGAAYARPESPVVVISGDGGFNYSLNELETLHEQNLNIKVVILNNDTLGWIKWYQAAVWDGRFTNVDTKHNDYGKIAEGMGVKGYHLHDPATLKEELSKIINEPGPALIDIRTTETEACKFTDNAAAVDYIVKDHKNK